MGKKTALFLATLTVVLSMAACCYGEEEEGWDSREGDRGWFLLHDSKPVVKTDAGNMRVVRGVGRRFTQHSPVHIGFITMEPKSLFIPQYLDSSLILFIRRGGARVGHIYKDEFVEKDLKVGDIYRIEAGSAFYIVNSAEGQRLHAICSIDTSHSLGWHMFQPFYIGGGMYPRSVLSGFDRLTLSTALNVSEAEISQMLSTQREGPIIYLSEPHAPPSVWFKFLDMNSRQKQIHFRKMAQMEEEEEEGEEESSTWSALKKLLVYILAGDNKRKTEKGQGSYNIYDKKKDFENSYGWSIALDESDYSPLKYDDIGVYLVNLTAGSMMAPHVNPRAIEYGIVLSGSGSIQIVHPNGTLAMNAEVAEGDVFWVPRYFAFCQIASRTGPFEFFGFTTSARNNRPQFLAGANSLLQAMMGPEFAAAFGLSEERLREIAGAQRESTIFPSATVAPPDGEAMMGRGFD